MAVPHDEHSQTTIWVQKSTQTRQISIGDGRRWLPGAEFIDNLFTALCHEQDLSCFGQQLSPKAVFIIGKLVYCGFADF